MKRMDNLKDYINHINSHEITGVVARIRGLSNLLCNTECSQSDMDFIINGLYASAQEVVQLNQKINRVYSDMLPTTFRKEEKRFVNDAEVLEYDYCTLI